jgi:hypothetical protein
MIAVFFTKTYARILNPSLGELDRNSPTRSPTTTPSPATGEDTNTLSTSASPPPPLRPKTMTQPPNLPAAEWDYPGVRDFARNRWPLRGSPADTRG